MKKLLRNKRIVPIVVLSLFLLIIIGCKDKEVKKVKQKAKQYLRETYDKEFVIKKMRYIEMPKEWEIRAAPKENRDWEFTVRTGGMFGEEIYSNYSDTKFTMESRKYYQPVLKRIFGRKMYFYSNVGTYTKYDPQQLPDFSHLLKQKSDSTYVIFFIHIFENVVSPPERKQKFLKNVMELLEYMRGQNLKWGKIRIRIYDEEFYKDKDIENILEETNFFHKGSRKLDYNAMEYESYMQYGLGINDSEYFEIETIEDLKKELNKANLKFQRE